MKTKLPRLRQGERVLLRRICEWPGLLSGGLFTPGDVRAEGRTGQYDLFGLLSLGILLRRTYRGGSSKLFLSPLGREVAMALWPPAGDPNSYGRKRKEAS